MLFNWWLDQSSWLVIAILAAGLYGSAALIHAVLFRSPIRAFVFSFHGIVAPFFTSVALLFGLLTSFLANDVWERQRQAERAVQTERDTMLATSTLSIATPSDMAPIRVALRSYVRAVVDDEWPLMGDQRQSDRADQALGVLMTEVARPSISVTDGAVAHRALMDLVLRLRTARNDRLAISSADYDQEKWATVLLLALLTQLSLALVHLDRPRPQIAVLTVFTAAAVVALGLVAVRERPFDGAHPIPADGIAAVLAGIAAQEDQAARPAAP